MGKDVEKEADFVQTQVSCIAQNVSADNYLTLHENMVFQGRLYGLPKNLLGEREQKLFELFELEEYISKKAGSCSSGIKRRLDIAMSMLSEPKILFLDEPTVAMDIQSRHIMWSTLEKLKRELGITILSNTPIAKAHQSICKFPKKKKPYRKSGHWLYRILYVLAWNL